MRLPYALLAIALLATPVASAAAPQANTHADGKGKAQGHAASDLLAAFHARYKEIMDSWRENATKLRESCRAEAHPADNATKDDRLAWAHCIRDGMKELRQSMLADKKAARAAKAHHGA